MRSGREEEVLGKPVEATTYFTAVEIEAHAVMIKCETKLSIF